MITSPSKNKPFLSFLPGKVLAAMIGLVGLLLTSVLFTAWYLTQPVDSRATETLTFVVPEGSGAILIAQKLKQENLIRSPLAFRLAIKIHGLTDQLQPGSFELSRSMNVFAVAQKLAERPEDQWVTIKEGWRAAEIGEYLESQLTNFSTQDPAFQSECLAYEGFLFPETYLVPKEFDTRQMCKLLREQYGEVFTFELRNQVTQNTGLNDEEAIILASIVEREARDPEQMRHVAGILLNRLEIGMALQVDATLQYAKGYDSARQTWWAPPVSLDKSLNSPYNTYQNPGLPRGPISNPGKNAIMAVANPIESDDLYYLHSDDGQMYYAQTYAEHQANIERYLR